MKVSSDLGSLQQDLWNASVKMRGSVSPGDYKKYVLPLLFLHALSEKYENGAKVVLEGKFQEFGLTFEDLEALPEDEKNLMIQEALGAENIFYISEKAMWSYIRAHKNSDKIKTILDDAMTDISKNNKSLEGILPRMYEQSPLTNEQVGGLIELFSNEIFNSKDAVDVLGRVYEYFITEFASSEGKRGGEFFTPSSIVNLIIHILDPQEGRLMDPAAGSGGMFIQSERYAEKKGSLSFIGQELNQFNILIGKMNVLLHGLDADLRLGNSLLNDHFSDVKVDYIATNVPFNIKEWGANKIEGNDPRLLKVRDSQNKTDSNANYFWLQHIWHHLNDNGKAGVVLSNGALTSNSKGEREVREALVSMGAIDAIVVLPAKLFLGTQIPSCVFFLNKNKRDKEKILFMDLRKMGVPVSRKNIQFTPEEIQKVADIYHAYSNGDDSYLDVEGFCKVVNLEDVRQQDYKLTPGIYVGTEATEADNVSFEEKMSTLQSLLLEQFEESNRLQQRIKQNLEGLL
ncbi:class I SAM-dependent DNA methyltransferase (plasmid) [Bacillus arachidis]|nr:class I SAM-dependent DNA methyltransferase [Bacillus arachidis]WIY59044.1 class I SAM-dependent DNA methyltransferase [Bacillus arachidis]